MAEELFYFYLLQNLVGSGVHTKSNRETNPILKITSLKDKSACELQSDSFPIHWFFEPVPVVSATAKPNQNQTETVSRL